MSNKLKLNDCEKGTEFAKYALDHPKSHDCRQSGSHLMVKGPQPGLAVIPVHNKPLPTGTKHSVIKMLLAIGLGVMVIAIFVH